jgi:hypothetical protein
MGIETRFPGLPVRNLVNILIELLWASKAINLFSYIIIILFPELMQILIHILAEYSYKGRRLPFVIPIGR